MKRRSKTPGDRCDFICLAKPAVRPSTPLVEHKNPRRPQLISWFQHLCNGGLHVVGLTQKGQLVFKNHTIRELVAEIKLAAFGSSSCKCASFLHNWMIGEKNGGVPFSISRERPWQSWSTVKDEKTGEQKMVAHRPDAATQLGFRLMQKRRARRDVRSYEGASSPLNRLLDGKGTFYGDAPKTLAETIAGVLRSWGWPVTVAGSYISMPKPKEWGTWPAYNDHVTVVHVDVRYNGYSIAYLQPTCGGEQICSIPADRCAAWDMRTLCDRAEASLIAKLVRVWQNVFHEREQKKQDERRDLLTKRLQHDHAKIKRSGDGKTFTVTFNYEEMTLLGAYLLAKNLLRQSRELLQKQLDASTARKTAVAKNPKRLCVPSPPGFAVGVATYRRSPHII